MIEVEGAEMDCSGFHDHTVEEYVETVQRGSRGWDGGLFRRMQRGICFKSIRWVPMQPRNSKRDEGAVLHLDSFECDN